MKMMTYCSETSGGVVRLNALKSACLAILVASSLFGCATTTSPPKLVEKTVTDTLHSRSPLHIAAYPPTSFEARGSEATPLSAAWSQPGLLGALIATWGELKAGERFRKDFSLNDPTLRLRDSVSADLKPGIASSEIRVAADPLETERLEELRARFGDSLLLSFKTTMWFFYPANTASFAGVNRYGIRYVVRGRLTDAASARTIWEDECDYVEAEADKYGPTFKDLTANDAAILKSMFSKASDYCATAFVEALLGKNQGKKNK